MRLMTSLTALIGSALAATSVSAQTALEDLEIVGAPIPNGVGFQPAATELARDVQWLDNFLLIIITVISLFVTGLLAYVDLALQQQDEPNSFDIHAQLASRSGMDCCSNRDLGSHRCMVVAHPVQATGNPRGRSHNQSDWLPMVLGLRIC